MNIALYQQGNHSTRGASASSTNTYRTTFRDWQSGTTSSSHNAERLLSNTCRPTSQVGVKPMNKSIQRSDE
ncbi:hypothetical protein J6590_068393 [Homalodisca vitripennis]|nr:hypothetical protein J6590_068393 [Homalodisca vitripennis]